jgi:hypothetical protein
LTGNNYGQKLTAFSFEELARSTEDMNGAQLKAVCVEAGMVGSRSPLGIMDSLDQLALRQNATKLNHEHFYGGILEVQAKKAKEHHVSLILLPISLAGCVVADRNSTSRKAATPAASLAVPRYMACRYSHVRVGWSALL